MKEALVIQPLEKTVFYALDRAIKSYRQFAQQNLRVHDLDITIDQWLILKTIEDHPDITQKEMADRVFKDYASVTRMIELLVQRGYLSRAYHPEDRRRHKLELTKSGGDVYEQLLPVVSTNRQKALEGISAEEIDTLKKLLNRITKNCTPL